MDKVITNNQIKRIKSLDRKANRIKYGGFVVEGEKNIHELLRSNFTITDLYVLPEFISKYTQMNLPLTSISKKTLQRISHLSTPNKALALVTIPSQQSIDPIAPAIVLDGINDPGNLGTILRTANWFGIQQIICSKNAVDVFNPKVVMASMGAIFQVKVYYTDLEKYFSSSRKPVYAAVLNGKSIYNTKFDTSCDLLLGSESHGISSALHNYINHEVTIPKTGDVESLNLSVATGIFCSHYAQGNK